MNNKKFCDKYYSCILPTIFNDLKTNENKDTNIYDDLFFQAIILLSGFSECCSIMFLEETLSFVIDNITNTNENLKKASVIAFGSILKSNHKEKLRGIIVDSLENFFDLIIDEKISLNLKESIFWVLVKITKNFFEIFEEKQRLEKMLNIIKIVLKSQNKKIISNSLEIIRVLYKNFKPEEGRNSNILSGYTKPLLQNLYLYSYEISDIQKNSQSQITQEVFENNLIYQTFLSIAAIIENSALDAKFVIFELFKKILEDFKKSLICFGFNYSDPGIYISKDLKDLYQNCYCICLCSFMISDLIQIDFQTGKEISELIYLSFKEREEVFEEGVYVISELALTLENEFEIIFKEGFGYFLINALKSSDTNLKRIVFIAISDIIRSLKEKFEPYLKEILPEILNHLKVKVLI